MSNLEHYFENLLFSGKDVKGDLNKNSLTKEEQTAVEVCANYVLFSLFCGRDDLKEFLEKYKVDGAEPVNHGRWEDKYGDGDWHCSVCGAIVEKDEQGRHNWNRCYHCGAKMDLKDHYCDRNRCLQMEYAGKGCAECEVE